MTVHPMRRGTLVRAAVLVAAALLALMAMGTSASAHADFVAAVPRAGSGIPQAPDDVVLRFSEPLIMDLSNISVLDDVGVGVTAGPTLPVPGDEHAMQRALGLLAPGQYTVRWTTTSPLDGHTLQGSYTFGIGVLTPGNETTASSPVDSEGWLGLAGRWLLLAGIGIWAGVVLLRRSVVWTATRPSWQQRLRLGAPAAVTVGGVLALAGSVLNATGGLTALPALVASQSGVLRTALPAVGLVGLMTSRATSSGAVRQTVHGAAAAAAVLLEAGSGHAASSATPLLALPLFAVHLATAGTWVTAVAIALVADLPMAQALRQLARPAVTVGLLAGATGVLTATVTIDGVDDLASTAYGRTLVLKSAAVAAMAGLGLWHRHRRRIGHERLRRPLRAELVTSVVVLSLATALVGYPNPPAESLEGQRRGGGNTLLTGVTAGGAVSLGRTDGPFIVGMTLAPPEPGAVEVRVRVEGAEPGDGLRDAELVLRAPSGATRTQTLSDCGFGCFTDRVDLSERGTWQVQLNATSNRQPITARFDVPLSTLDGQPTFRRMMAAMRAADAVVVTEDLRADADAEPITSVYEFAAPDRMRWSIGGGSVRIGIEQDGWAGDGTTFEAYDWPGDGFNWPAGFYESFFADTAAVRLLGTDVIDGQPVEVLTFVHAELPAWFRVSLEPDSGRIRRLRMLAEGHLMVQNYTAYDTQVVVEPPPPDAVTGRR